MKTRVLAIPFILAFMLSPCESLQAQKSDCGEVDAMAHMARSISSKELAGYQQAAGNGYQARVVFAVKRLEFYPQDREAALQLLNLIPADDHEQHLLMTLGDHLCGAEPVREMKLLDQLGERLPRELSKAVLLVPEKLPEYVAYSIPSVQDPHSDYAVQMQKVCKARHEDFVQAIAKLPPAKMRRFLRYVFNPDGCDALALPENTSEF
jgi:hypothetical protein